MKERPPHSQSQFRRTLRACALCILRAARRALDRLARLIRPRSDDDPWVPCDGGICYTAGGVGVGTATFSSVVPLTAYHGMDVVHAINPFVGFSSVPGTDLGYVQVVAGSPNKLDLNPTGAGVLTFSTTDSDTERMRISATGGLSLGTPTWNATDPGAGNMAIQGNVGIGKTPSETHTLDVAGDGNFSGALYSAPVAPKILANLSSSATGGTGYTYAQDDIAYATSDAGAVTLFDISDPANPRIIGQIVNDVNLPYAEGLAVIGPYLFVAVINTNTLYMLDTRKIVGSVSLASARVASITDPTLLDSCEHIEASGNLLLIANLNSTAGHAQFAVVQVTTSPTPGISIIGHLSDPRLYGAVYIDVEGTVAYLTARAAASLNAIDFSTPSLPAITSSFAPSDISGNWFGDATGVCVRAGWAYVACKDRNAIAPVDISNPAAMALGTPVVDSAQLNNPSNVHFAGRYLYATCYGSASGGGPDSGVAILSLATPSAPALLDYFNPATSGIECDHLDIWGRVGILANTAWPGGILLLDLGGVEAAVGRIGHLESDDVDVARDIRVARNLLLGGRISFLDGSGSPGPGGVTTQVDFTTSLTPGTPQGPAGPKPAMFSLTIALNAGASIDIRSGPDASSLTSIISGSAGILVDSSPPGPPAVLWTFTWWQLPGTWFVVNLTGTYNVMRMMEWY